MIGSISNVLPTHAASQTITRLTSYQRSHVQPRTATTNTSDTVLLIHGVSGSSKTDCTGYWNNAQQYLRGTHAVDGQQIHWTGTVLKIGYYAQDYNCDLYLSKISVPQCKGYEDINLGTNNESIKHIACELAWYIYKNYTQLNHNVEVVGHSMGGLIIRWAVACSTTSKTKAAPCISSSNKNPFPDALLLVRDVVDFDTPNGGIPRNILNIGIPPNFYLGNNLGCKKNKKGVWVCPIEVQQMFVGSSFMTNLDTSAQNPQGAQGTFWTLMGVTKGTDCFSLPANVSMYMDGGNKILYTSPCYSHVSFLTYQAMMDHPSDTLDAVVQYCANCPKTPTSWQNASAYPHALLNMLYALTELPAVPLIVTTTADLASPCTSIAYSLRCAINQANADSNGDTIRFLIPSSDFGCKATTINGQNVYVCTITPTSGFPQLLACNTIIDGYTQPGAQKNTLSIGSGDNAILTIRIDGSKGGGLVIGGVGSVSNDTVQGLEVTNVNSYGILVYTIGTTNITIKGNFIGTDGSNTLGNGTGIYIASGSSNDTVGGVTPDAANLISGNSGQGITIGAGSGNTIEGNYIGTDTSGTTALHKIKGVETDFKK